MMNLIKSAAIYNAAITRSQNASDFQVDLKQLCGEILKFAGATQSNADLVQKAEKVKHEIENMRNFVQEQISIDTDKNPSTNQEKEKINHIKDLQNKITEIYTQIMADLSRFCEEVMGEAPCKFAVVGMGSLARKEITPYSDFEHIIVLEEISLQETQKENVLNYFRWFSVIFQTVVLNLQETILPSVLIYSLNDKASKHGDWFYDAFTTRGISFDGMMPHVCKFPLGRQQFTDNKPWTTELIKPVSEMLKYLTTEEDLKNGYHLKDILTKICFVYGDATIYDDFEFCAHKMLEEDNQIVQIDNIKRQILQDLEKFAARNTLLELLSSKVFNLKQVVYRSTTLFLAALGRIFNIQSTSSFDIIQKLTEINTISKDAEHKMMFAVALACEIRLKWYLNCRRQNDTVKSTSNNDTAIGMLLTLTTKQNIVSYFETAYALQCDISNRFNLDKKFFYSNPKLFSSSLYYCLGEKQTFIALTLEYRDINDDKKQKLFTFDDCVEQCQYNKEKFYKNIISKNKKKLRNKPLKNEIEIVDSENLALTKYFKEFGIYLQHINKHDEALEYFKTENNILSEMLKNCATNQKSIKARSNHVKAELVTITSANTFEETFCENTTEYTPENVLRRKISESLQKIGNCYMEINQFSSALEYFKRSLEIQQEISKGIDSDREVSISLNNIGRCLIKMNQLTDAMDNLKQSLKIKQKFSQDIDIDLEVSLSLHEIGRCLIKMNQLIEALDYLNRSLEIKQRTSLDVDRDREISLSLHEIGRCLIKMNQLPKAFDYLKQSLEIQKQISLGVDSDRDIALSLSYIGRCLMKIKHFSESLDYYNQSLKISQKMSLGVDSDYDISSSLNDISCCLIRMNQFNEALDYLKQSLKSNNEYHRMLRLIFLLQKY